MSAASSPVVFAVIFAVISRKEVMFSPNARIYVYDVFVAVTYLRLQLDLEEVHGGLDHRDGYRCQ